ncbi:hypothetical protein C3941_18745 [Kaistia algarum]|uniref:hypothetical protein n=1 Tax=Kaistia algarum TaxID=2083279 RepID=UPI000CE92B4F|nr:hypothetical protein [Kaistia algarum]MCX5516517.1 hypothetical protein [Kaistia algarum]PPE78368.1 hypothetical protein C3941_18745 [Kaistia algarum]
MKSISSPALAGWFAIGVLASAQAQAADISPVTAPVGPVVAPASLVPDHAFFGGLGLGVGYSDFSDQSLYAQGVSVISQGGVPYAYGSAGGTTYPSSGSDTTLTPMAQLGYFQKFTGTDWLWGGKLAYSYLGAVSTADNVAVPQAGSFTGPSPASFTGNVVVRSYETKINQQIALTPFIGRSFGWGFLYAGAGPSISQTETNMNGVYGFADINGSHYDITGPAANYSSSDWVLGGTLTVGGTYFINRDWFLDASYAVNFTQKSEGDFSSPFSTSAAGFDDAGILSGNFSGGVTTQTVTISINRSL